jgi:hypothetical protein
LKQNKAWGMSSRPFFYGSSRNPGKHRNKNANPLEIRRLVDGEVSDLAL